jgi:hypothetical protein
MPIALIRDLTDALYNPARPPYVSHEEGTRLVVEYIEKFWCPTRPPATTCSCPSRIGGRDARSATGSSVAQNAVVPKVKIRAAWEST